ncbi:MAG TPA: PaaI family thioesterase [Longimicrobium sp.]|nr:PaaI family thioesterase [Longimicrobium sp.]
MTPPDDEATRVRASFARQTAMHTLGIEIAHVAPGEVDLRMPYRADLAQQHGYLHAGMVATLADTASGYAAYTLMPPGADVVSVEFKLNLLAPALGDAFVARARVKKSGRTLSVVTADVFALRDESERLVATMQATMMALGGEGTGDRGQGTGDRGQGTGDRGQGIRDRG